MKRCPECNAIYEDGLDVCPTCGERLETFRSTSRPQQRRTEPAPEPTYIRDNFSERSQGSNTYTFEQVSGNRVVINGAVAESSTQQYYQSKLTKLFRALFSGEPYQLSHTTFVTIFRVEEHTTVGYPENARDITLFGGMQNIFAVGDDVTVTAKRKGSRLIATDIYNHSINGNVRIQANIPAGLIQFFALLILAAVVFLVYGLATADYAAMGSAAASGIASLISRLLPLALVIGLVVAILKGIIKG